MTSVSTQVAIAQSDQNIATAQLAAKRASITDLQGVICQLEGEVAKISNERDAALEDLLSTHDEYRYLLSKSEDEPEESTLVSLQILPTMEVKDGRKRFMSDRIAEYQRIVHEFKLKGGRISQLFHRVLQFFTGCSEHEARAVARLPQHSQQYDHTQMMGMAKQHSMSIARDESRPFYATECDEVSITRSKFMLNFVMFGTPDIPIPTRLLAGAVRISNTTGHSEFGGVKQSLDTLFWSPVFWLWWTSDSAASMLVAVDLARGAKLRDFNRLLGDDFVRATFMPEDTQLYFMVHVSTPTMLIPLSGPHYIPDGIHMSKNGESGMISELGSGVNLASGKLVYNFLKGELFRLVRLDKPSLEFRDLLRHLHPEVADLYRTMPGDIKHRINIITKIAKVFSGCRDEIRDVCWQMNLVYGKGVWKGDRQPVLDHLKEVWASTTDVRLQAWCTLFAKLHDVGKDLYTDIQVNKGFNMVYARREAQRCHNLLLDFDTKFEEIFEVELKEIMVWCDVAIASGQISQMAKATVKALAAVRKEKAKVSDVDAQQVESTSEDRSGEDDFENVLDPSLAEDIAVYSGQDLIELEEEEAMDVLDEVEAQDEVEAGEGGEVQGAQMDGAGGVANTVVDARQVGDAQVDGGGSDVQQVGDAQMDGSGSDAQQAGDAQMDGGGSDTQQAGDAQIDGGGSDAQQARDAQMDGGGSDVQQAEDAQMDIGGSDVQQAGDAQMDGGGSDAQQVGDAQRTGVMKGSLQGALSRNEEIDAVRLFNLLCEDFRRGIRKYHSYMKERHKVYIAMPYRIFSYYDPEDGVLNLLEDYIRFGFHMALDDCGATLCKIGCQVCRYVGGKGVIITQVMSRMEYLIEGGHLLGFWDNPHHQADLQAIVKNPTSIAVMAYADLPNGIANLGVSLMQFYETYLNFATSESMFTERKGGEAKRMGVTGNVTSLRAFAQLNEQGGVLTDQMRADISKQRREANNAAPSKYAKDRDQHVAEFERIKAEAQAELVFKAQESARDQEAKRLAAEEESKKKAARIAEQVERERVKEANRIATTQRKEERKKKTEEASRQKQLRDAAGIRNKAIQKKKAFLKTMNKVACLAALHARGITDVTMQTKVDKMREALLLHVDELMQVPAMGQPQLVTAATEPAAELPTEAPEPAAPLSAGAPELAAQLPTDATEPSAELPTEAPELAAPLATAAPELVPHLATAATEPAAELPTDAPEPAAPYATAALELVPHLAMAATEPAAELPTEAPEPAAPLSAGAPELAAQLPTDATEPSAELPTEAPELAAPLATAAPELVPHLATAATEPAAELPTDAPEPAAPLATAAPELAPHLAMAATEPAAELPTEAPEPAAPLSAGAPELAAQLPTDATEPSAELPTEAPELAAPLATAAPELVPHLATAATEPAAELPTDAPEPAAPLATAAPELAPHLATAATEPAAELPTEAPEPAAPLSAGAPELAAQLPTDATEPSVELPMDAPKSARPKRKGVRIDYNALSSYGNKERAHRDSASSYISKQPSTQCVGADDGRKRRKRVDYASLSKGL
ncbi:hypothetical protein CYMTET_48993 [Cymbomonas tetramitiformis]|uniref:Uncharacterized protein n=1 Tax=Cymbomonas tetramitiformis TaxID=36881 RepID=A0AAE0BSR5_9CHLO|nr:hypothetical protein CYMTET_48993 [Cymbomonas tetramitiformis]